MSNISQIEVVRICVFRGLTEKDFFWPQIDKKKIRFQGVLIGQGKKTFWYTIGKICNSNYTYSYNFLQIINENSNISNWKFILRLY